MRGTLIGAVEVVPGVSGGTVALIVGVYATLIDAASHIVRGLVASADVVRGRGMTRTAAHFRAVRWSVVAPVLLGMVVAVVVGPGSWRRWCPRIRPRREPCSGG